MSFKFYIVYFNNSLIYFSINSIVFWIFPDLGGDHDNVLLSLNPSKPLPELNCTFHPNNYLPLGGHNNKLWRQRMWEKYQCSWKRDMWNKIVQRKIKKNHGKRGILRKDHNIPFRKVYEKSNIYSLNQLGECINKRTAYRTAYNFFASFFVLLSTLKKKDTH